MPKAIEFVGLVCKWGGPLGGWAAVAAVAAAVGRWWLLLCGGAPKLAVWCVAGDSPWHLGRPEPCPHSLPQNTLAEVCAGHGPVPDLTLGLEATEPPYAGLMALLDALEGNAAVPQYSLLLGRNAFPGYSSLARELERCSKMHLLSLQNCDLSLHPGLVSALCESGATNAIALRALDLSGVFGSAAQSGQAWSDGTRLPRSALLQLLRSNTRLQILILRGKYVISEAGRGFVTNFTCTRGGGGETSLWT